MASKAQTPPEQPVERRLVKNRRKSGSERRIGPSKKIVSASAQPTAKRNVMGTRVGYDPYESGQLVKLKNPGVRRDLRELGQWLKSTPKGGK